MLTRKRKHNTISERNEREDEEEICVKIPKLDPTMEKVYQEYANSKIYFAKSLGSTTGIIRALRAFKNTESGAIHLIKDEDNLPHHHNTNNWNDGFLMQVSKPNLKSPTECWVATDDYVRPTFEDRFSPAIDANKVLANFEFVQFLKIYDPKQEDLVLYLDSPTAHTTVMLISAGYKKSNLFVPNPGIVADLDGNWMRDITQVFDSAVLEFLRDMDPEDEDEFHFGLDYCCTFEGNENMCKPKQDLILIFGQKRLKVKNGVLWLTVCFRGQSQKQCKSSLQSHVRKLSKQYGYSIALLQCRSYKQMMYFIFVTGVKD